MNIYQISQEYQEALYQLSQIDDITPEIIEDTLSGIKCELEDKAINIAAYIKNLTAECEAVRKAKKEMATREYCLLSKIEKMKNWLKEQLIACEIKRIKKTPHFEIKIQKNPCSLDVFKLELIPQEFINFEVIENINNQKIKEALKNGHQVPGARLENGTALIIK
jgi:hypothetical protein